MSNTPADENPLASLRGRIDEAVKLADRIDARLKQNTVEWTSAQHILTEDLKTLKHDQASLRTVINAILDELEAMDAKAKVKAKGVVK